MLKLLYEDWPVGSPLRDGLLFLFFSSLTAMENVTIAERALSQCSKELGTATAGRRGHLQIVRDRLMVKLTLTRFSSFTPNHLRSRLTREEEEVARAGAWRAEVLVIKIVP